jgi:hypothetical protein
MHDTLRSGSHSNEMDKKDNDVTHLEKVNTHSPPSELEKGQQLAPTVSRGPEVHEKVQYLQKPLQRILTHGR